MEGNGGYGEWTLQCQQTAQAWHVLQEGDRRILCNYRDISLIEVAAKVLASSSSKGCSQRGTSEPALTKVALDLGVDAPTKFEICIAH